MSPLVRASAPVALLTLALLAAPAAADWPPPPASASTPARTGTVALTFPDPVPGATLRSACSDHGCGIGLSNQDGWGCGPTVWGSALRTGDRYYYSGLRVATNAYAGAEDIGLVGLVYPWGDCQVPESKPGPYVLHSAVDTAKASNVIPMEMTLCPDLPGGCIATHYATWTLYACPAATTTLVQGDLLRAGPIALGSEGIMECGASGPALAYDASHHLDVHGAGVLASRYDPPDVADIVPPGAGDSYVLSCVTVRVVAWDEDGEMQHFDVSASDYFLALDPGSGTWDQSLRRHLDQLRGLFVPRADNGCGALAACFWAWERVQPGEAFTVDAGCSRSTFDATPAVEARWDFEDDGAWDTAFSSGLEAVHSYPDHGRHTIRLEIRSSTGGTAQATADILVADDPPVGSPPPPGNQTSSGGSGGGSDPRHHVATHPGGTEVHTADRPRDEQVAVPDRPGPGVRTG